ncbi:MAG: DUF4154 domain-containing protein [Alphaproteobacteria bacterium]|nr:DUF4154 domain-containing protein [Alphaproteobacteria bacterium]
MAVLRIFVLVTAIVCTLCAGAAHSAEPLRLNEQKIKAGLLYNIAKYTVWPTSAFPEKSSVLQICLLGGDAFDGALNPLQGHIVQQRKINIKTLHFVDTDTKCHIQFVNSNMGSEIETIKEYAQERNILTLSDIKGFSSKGGMIEFALSPDNRIEIYLDRNMIQRSGLRIGEQIIRLAKVRQ